MKVVIDSIKHVRRGGPVEVGNVYTNPHGKNVFKVVVAIVPDNARARGRPWNNIVLLDVMHDGTIVRGHNEPETYIREHQDLVGKVKEFGTLKIEWLRK